MKAASGPENILRLHTAADGNVWYGRYHHDGVDSGCQVDAFLKSTPFLGARRIRVLGTAGNAALLRALFFLKRSRGMPERPSQGRTAVVSPSVQIGSPAICYRSGPADPVFVLRQLWQVNTSATATVPGFWHEMNEFDYVTYALICAVHAAGGAVNELALRHLKYHPAWPALSFLPGADPAAGCQLVAEIVDPRWFAHSVRPNRLSRLYAYLGVTRHNAQWFHEGVPGGRNASRMATVLATWFNNRSGSPDLKDPANFLWRIYHHHGGGIKGLLRASERFVRFLREVWLQEIAPPRRVVFQPTTFFKLPAEAERYRTHRAGIAAR